MRKFACWLTIGICAFSIIGNAILIGMVPFLELGTSAIAGEDKADTWGAIAWRLLFSLLLYLITLVLGILALKRKQILFGLLITAVGITLNIWPGISSGAVILLIAGLLLTFASRDSVRPMNEL